MRIAYAVVTLYPSVPVDKAIKVLRDTLNSAKEQLKEQTKLAITIIHKLTELLIELLLIELLLIA